MATIPCIEGMIVFRKYTDESLKDNPIDFRVKAHRKAIGYNVDSLGVMHKEGEQCVVIEPVDQNAVQATPFDEFLKKSSQVQYRLISDFNPEKYPERAKLFVSEAKKFVGQKCDCTYDEANKQSVYGEKLVVLAAQNTAAQINKTNEENGSPERVRIAFSRLSIPFAWLNLNNLEVSNYLDNIYTSHPDLESWLIHNPMIFICSSQFISPPQIEGENFPEKDKKSAYTYSCQITGTTLDEQWTSLIKQFPPLVTEPAQYIVSVKPTDGSQKLVLIKSTQPGVDKSVILNSEQQPELVEKVLSDYFRTLPRRPEANQRKERQPVEE